MFRISPGELPVAFVVPDLHQNTTVYFNDFFQKICLPRQVRRLPGRDSDTEGNVQFSTDRTVSVRASDVKELAIIVIL